MYVVANRVPVAPAWAARFEERFRRRAGEIDKQVGFISMQVLRPMAADSPYIVLTTWEDEVAFHNWVGSDDFKAAHANPLPAAAFNGEARLEQHEVVIAAPG